MALHGGAGHGRPWLIGMVLALGLSLLTSCGSDPEGGTDAKAKAKAPRKAEAPSHPFYCDAVGDGTPLGGHGNGSHVAGIYEGQEKGRLDEADCRQVTAQFDQANAAVAHLGTRGEAEAAGWNELAAYIPGLGTHHVEGSFRDLFTKAFDPADPAFLIYGGVDADAPLVGLGYLSPGPADPPAAFAGTNDWWHLHRKICYAGDGKVLAGAEEIPDDECVALGGRQIDLGAGIWLLHVWTVPDYELKLDVFASGHPCLGETEPLPRDDECWDHAGRHPAEGLPPDHPADGHGHATKDEPTNS